MCRSHHPRRAAFTLMELLVVIAIIAILVALLTAGVFGFIRRADDARNAVEVGQLATAIGVFKEKFKIYPPSIIRLREDGGYAGADQLDVDSIYFLRKMWPRIDFSGGIDWNGNGTIDGPVVLEGDQCLVFFLGGVPTPGGPGCMGFSTKATNPADRSDLSSRVGPFYEFNTARLALLRPNNPYYSYLDVYYNYKANLKKPFAYFSSGRSRNDYLRLKTSMSLFDCQTIGAAPYIQPGQPLYHNPDTFQIISAGLDQQFGPNSGGVVVWDPANPDNLPAEHLDNRTNFSSATLAAGNK